MNADRDTDVPIIRSRRVVCDMCGTVIDRMAPTTYEHLAGWARNRTGGGAHSVTLPERDGRFACGECIHKALHGIAIGQRRLF